MKAEILTVYLYQQPLDQLSRRRLLLMLLLSIAAHFLLFTQFHYKTQTTLLPSTIKVALKDFSHSTPQQRTDQIKQLVQPSSNTDTPKVPHFASDHDSSTAREQLKRGQLDTGIPSVTRSSKNDLSQKSHSIQKRINTEKSQATEIKNPKLFLNATELENTITSQTTKKELLTKQNSRPIKKPPLDQLRESEFNKAIPFEKQSAKGLFAGPIGSPDYLPNIPDGDITLLNSKADQFAVFVRRVALQVFGAIKRKNWQELSTSELRRLNNFSTIHAKMNKEGQLVSIKLMDSSGSILFDNLVKDSVQFSARDQNPPAEAAAEDGNIHFIFKSRSWVRPTGERGLEQRWILLGTGLL